MHEREPGITDRILDDTSEATGRTRLALESARVLGNETVAPDVYVLTLEASRCARLCAPAQFIQLAVPGDRTELLRLPFSVYRTDTASGAIQVMYQVIGEGTGRMSTLVEGTSCDLIGPIGHGWNPPEDAHRALLVSGGLGAAPLVMLAEQLASSGVEVDICMGAPTSERLVARSDLERHGRVHVATDDGSEGLHGFCTTLSEDLLSTRTYDYVATCGPYPMERIVASQSSTHGVFCEASLETLMACGIGVCLSCVVDTCYGKRRVCVDGPVFDSSEVIWR